VDFRIEEYESELRRIAEARVGSFDSARWDYWFEEIRDETFFNVEQAADVLVDKIRGAMHNLPRRGESTRRPASGFGAAPEWWPAYAKDRLDTWRDVQSQVLAAFGLDAPITLREADTMLVKALDSQERVGLKASLEFTHYPTYERDLVSPGSETADVPIVEEGLAYSGKSLGWNAQGRAENAPYVLATYAGMLEWQTGCQRFEAVDYLLCNEPFDVAWVRANPREGSGVIEIRVGSPSVPATDVCKAYQAAVASIRDSQPHIASAAPKLRRARRARTLALLAFVADVHPGAKTLQDWGKLRTQWNTAHPEWTFPTAQAMRERHRRVAPDPTDKDREG
jgi:hypothetical protein